MLLQHLAANAGKVILNAELLSKVWGPEYRDDLQYLRVWVSRLRAKLEVTPSSPLIIKTLQGIGYLFEADAEASEAAEGTVSAATVQRVKDKLCPASGGRRGLCGIRSPLSASEMTTRSDRVQEERPMGVVVQELQDLVHVVAVRHRTSAQVVVEMSQSGSGRRSEGRSGRCRRSSLSPGRIASAEGGAGALEPTWRDKVDGDGIRAFEQ
jgi:hypothetical protein